jgi:predicted DNA-binding transcriptional regulator AlpA
LDTTISEPPLLLNVEDVARLCSCSIRHIEKRRKEGSLPATVPLGGKRLIRWRREDIVRWIAEGCPATQNAGGAAEQ